MTYESLNQVFYLEKEVTVLRNIEKRLRDKLESVEVVMSDMPKGHSNQDKMAMLVAELVDLTNRIDLLEADKISTIKETIGEIQAVDDAELRTMLMARFVCLETWVGVSEIIGGNCTPDSARKKVTRFLKKGENDG